MDKDIERTFLETMSRALVSLPFDLKVLLEAVADSDLERDVRELAAATVVHVITPKDGNVEAPLRFSEDVRPASPRAGQDRRRGRRGRARVPAALRRGLRRASTSELELFRQTFGDDIVDWLDSRWGALLKAVYSKKKIAMFVDDEEVGTFLYDEGLRFGTLYPDHGEVARRAGQAGPAVRRPPGAQARSGQEEDHVLGAGSGFPVRGGLPVSRVKAGAPFGAEPSGLLDLAVAVAEGERRPPPEIAVAARAAAPLLVHAPARSRCARRSRR